MLSLMANRDNQGTRIEFGRAIYNKANQESSVEEEIVIKMARGVGLIVWIRCEYVIP
jgi:hypothetical protein